MLTDSNVVQRSIYIERIAVIEFEMLNRFAFCNLQYTKVSKEFLAKEECYLSSCSCKAITLHASTLSVLSLELRVCIFYTCNVFIENGKRMVPLFDHLFRDL